MNSPALRAVSVSPLIERARAYLNEEDCERLRAAYRFSDEAHLGQFRQSGEPYVSHPLAVAELCTQWRLDAQALMAALLHDTVEDTTATQEQIAERFGKEVAELVDGLSKLDAVEFRNREEAQAENFRKMLLAMARDVRVILIKIADRLHNMRTLGGVSPEKRRRVARETLDIYAPIAHRLGLNAAFRELEDLSFSGLYPQRYATLSKAVRSARGNRREVVSRLQSAITQQLPKFGIQATVEGREKSLWSTYRKMIEKHLSFAEVLDVYGFRVLVSTISDCYLALGALHALYKPMPGKFKDYIALPKSNGYQSLHTTVIGPYGTPVEFQIRTEEMHHVSEAGVAAHWMYKEHPSQEASPLQARAHEWMQSLVQVQSQTRDPSEFLDSVKIDLFPDVVYVFTPKGAIRELPRGSTPVDFAYNVHSDVGNHCVSAEINHRPAGLDTPLRNGDVVHIQTAPQANPHPAWLGFVRTAKARAEIRHRLKTTTRTEAIEFGQRLLEQALKALGADGIDDPKLEWQQFLAENSARDRDALLEDIGLGLTLADVAARRLMPQPAGSALSRLPDHARHALAIAQSHFASRTEAITIDGSEGSTVQYAACCSPIGGDAAIGLMRGGAGLVVHRATCGLGRRQRAKDPARWADIIWAEDLKRLFQTELVVETQDLRGILARVASAISAAEANIVGANTAPKDQTLAIMNLTLEVRERQHLANVLRRVRRVHGVIRAIRVAPQRPNGRVEL
ncbi:MAG: bifunctional (p)ppGpp synthetase/guanosine-3',5'-bis(diphosphate) 3'-pyrophosphohydrolase [Burkholderiaceae bacterium]|nr:bifunctional (p)ppGpp synthetase/guanosine-3',5'-bis(diphosphate) 3'-pyrophosphohydrolase [Burkholderiaceae bacterium]